MRYRKLGRTNLEISEIGIGGIGPMGKYGPVALLLIAGPCQVEGRDHALFCAERLRSMVTKGLRKANSRRVMCPDPR